MVEKAQKRKRRHKNKTTSGTEVEETFKQRHEGHGNLVLSFKANTFNTINQLFYLSVDEICTYMPEVRAKTFGGHQLRKIFQHVLMKPGRIFSLH